MDKLMPYILAGMITIMGFLSREVYSELKSKPTSAEVQVLIDAKTEMIIETQINPLKDCVSGNTIKINTFQVTLEHLVEINATLIRIDDRTIKQGQDISEIKGKIDTLK